MRHIDNMVLAVFVLSAMLSMSEGCPHAAADRARRAPERMSVHLVLARMCAHEASLPVGLDDDGDGAVDRWVTHRDRSVAWGNDCYGIHAVLLRGAARIREERPGLSLTAAYLTFARQYSSGRFDHPPPTDGNRWAMDLRPQPGHEPAGWHGMPWAAAEPGWRWAWLHTGWVSRMTLADFEGPGAIWSCDEPIHDWGGRMDHEHARAIGLIPVRCDGTSVNDWYARPGLRSHETER